MSSEQASAMMLLITHPLKLITILYVAQKYTKTLKANSPGAVAGAVCPCVHHAQRAGCALQRYLTKSGAKGTTPPNTL